MSNIYIFFYKIALLITLSHSKVIKRQKKIVYKNLIVKEIFDQHGNPLYTGDDRQTSISYKTDVEYVYVTIPDDEHYSIDAGRTVNESNITDMPSDDEVNIQNYSHDSDQEEGHDEKQSFHEDENIDEENRSDLDDDSEQKEKSDENAHSNNTIHSNESVINDHHLRKIQKGDLKNYEENYEDFVDGKYSCDTFPEGNGVIRLDHLNLGGWSGTYYPPDTSTNGPCVDGTYCSYSCQSGMLKTQWPKEQPENGVSVGGLLCKDGKLYRSNKEYDLLCIWGENKAIVVSQLNERVSICGTDYPGTENMVLPTVLDKGQSSPLSVVNMKTYYKWRNMQTSAQYYVNHAGVDYVQGCSWGNKDSEYGNWSPINFGAGYIDGLAYLSLIPNPNNVKPLNFNVKIVPDGDDSVLNGNCVYENGVFIGNDNGCTTTVTKGRGKFVLYY